MSKVAGKIELFQRRFIQRDDCYPLQLAKGRGYTVVRDKLTAGTVKQHLQGVKTIGLYGSADSLTKWLCVDIDDLAEVAVREVQNHARRFNIPYLTEYSGKKGYHLWVFFDGAYPNRVARALAGALAGDHEVFPKQDFVAKGKLGNLVKAPLGKHQMTGNWCLFLNEYLEPYKKQYEVLANIQTINPIEIFREKLPDTWKKLTEKPNKKNRVGITNADLKISIIRDCVRNAIFQGSNHGNRNQTGHIIASELRRIGFAKHLAESILSEIWNQRNNPPLADSEINTIIYSAFGDSFYEYTCKENGLLVENLKCLGQQNCFFFSLTSLNKGDKNHALSAS